MDNLLLAYIAGAIDSDGFITIRRQTYSIRVRKDSSQPAYCEWVGIKQTSPVIVDLIHEHFGGCRGKEKSASKNGKPLYSARLNNKKAHALIVAILPYLRIKKRQAEILLRLRKMLSEKREHKHIVKQMGRWGSKIDVTKYSLSERQVVARESLLIEIRSLNDTRISAAHTPKPWK